MSPTQIEVIAAAILSRGPKCNLLVFGLGHDSPIWAAINSSGYSLFLENVPEWIGKVHAEHPQLNIAQVNYDGTTVASAIRDPLATIDRAQVPPILLERKWDVIIIDGPMGCAPHLPGRSLPICWAKKMADASTHIFIDDYDRGLESTYADFLFAASKPNGRMVIPRQATRVASAGAMLWIVGTSPVHTAAT